MKNNLYYPFVSLSDEDIFTEIKKEREDLGLTQTEMAAGVISTAHYSKIERDKHDISAYDLFEILTKNII